MYICVYVHVCPCVCERVFYEIWFASTMARQLLVKQRTLFFALLIFMLEIVKEGGLLVEVVHSSHFGTHKKYV